MVLPLSLMATMSPPVPSTMGAGSDNHVASDSTIHVVTFLSSSSMMRFDRNNMNLKYSSLPNFKVSGASFFFRTTCRLVSKDVNASYAARSVATNRVLSRTPLYCRTLHTQLSVIATNPPLNICRSMYPCRLEIDKAIPSALPNNCAPSALSSAAAFTTLALAGEVSTRTPDVAAGAFALASFPDVNSGAMAGFISGLRRRERAPSARAATRTAERIAAPLRKIANIPSRRDNPSCERGRGREASRTMAIITNEVCRLFPRSLGASGH
mmetsp:Transcript_1458/g.4068  ORF Transcript_1458/g.4068 Transcript_1458/m.4068 type:complete len:268 (-) Transcript_1458:119-922(-)